MSLLESPSLWVQWRVCCTKLWYFGKEGELLHFSFSLYHFHLSITNNCACFQSTSNSSFDLNTTFCYNRSCNSRSSTCQLECFTRANCGTIRACEDPDRYWCPQDHTLVLVELMDFWCGELCSLVMAQCIRFDHFRSEGSSLWDGVRDWKTSKKTTWVQIEQKSLQSVVLKSIHSWHPSMRGPSNPHDQASNCKSGWNLRRGKFCVESNSTFPAYHCNGLTAPDEMPLWTANDKQADMTHWSKSQKWSCLVGSKM